MALLTRTRVAQEEIDRLNALIKDGDVARRALEQELKNTQSELADALRANQATAKEVERLLVELQSEATASIRVREALAAFMTNVDAAVKVLMASIK